MQCIQVCDDTPGCVDVSYIEGEPGPCFLKAKVGPRIPADRILGGRRISECTFASSTLKLHRKRVIVPVARIAKRAYTVGPGWIFTSTNTATKTITATTTSTGVRLVHCVEVMMGLSN